jgi:hypothetical protein
MLIIAIRDSCGSPPIRSRKKRLVIELGYDPSFWVPGHIRVDPAHLRNAITNYGSLDKLLEDTD